MRQTILALALARAGIRVDRVLSLMRWSCTQLTSWRWKLGMEEALAHDASFGMSGVQFIVCRADCGWSEASTISVGVLALATHQCHCHCHCHLPHTFPHSFIVVFGHHSTSLSILDPLIHQQGSPRRCVRPPVLASASTCQWQWRWQVCSSYASSPSMLLPFMA